MNHIEAEVSGGKRLGVTKTGSIILEKSRSKSFGSININTIDSSDDSLKNDEKKIREMNEQSVKRQDMKNRVKDGVMFGIASNKSLSFHYNGELIETPKNSKKESIITRR